MLVCSYAEKQAHSPSATSNRANPGPGFGIRILSGWLYKTRELGTSESLKSQIPSKQHEWQLDSGLDILVHGLKTCRCLQLALQFQKPLSLPHRPAANNWKV